MIGAVLGLHLQMVAAGAAPVFVDDRPEIPWIVVATPGGACGSTRTRGGPRGTKETLLSSLAKTPETKPPPKKSPSSTLPLLPGPGLFGVEGEAIVVAAERMLLKLGVGGKVSLRIDASGAVLELPPLPPQTVLQPDFSAADVAAIAAEAEARVARRRAVIGSLASERALRFSCHAVADDPALPLDLARRLRARFALPVR